MHHHDDATKGLYGKFSVQRNDGRSAPGEKHDGCEYFVLDLTHDPFAVHALCAYASACRSDFPKLAADLESKLDEMTTHPKGPDDD